MHALVSNGRCDIVTQPLGPKFKRPPSGIPPGCAAFSIPISGGHSPLFPRMTTGYHLSTLRVGDRIAAFRQSLATYVRITTGDHLATLRIENGMATGFKANTWSRIGPRAFPGIPSTLRQMSVCGDAPL